MPSPADFREIVSGRRKEALATGLRCVLRIAETPYRLAVTWRNRRYDRSPSLAQQVGEPVVSVGNLTLGGTGKTPLVKWLARWFMDHGARPAIVSRGYKAIDGLNDEARELAMSLPDVKQVQDPDRVAGARAAIDRYGSDLILLDDGFQHRRLARNLDIVLLDALEPFGFDHVFPRGTLREPVSGLRRAQVVCLSRANLIGEKSRAAIRRRAAELAPDAAWCEIIHAPTSLLAASGETQPLETLRDNRVAAFCGIGNPAGFRETLAATGCEVVAWREFPDHHAYDADDVAAISQLAETSRAELIVCTQKDLVKLPTAQIAKRTVWAVAIEIEFIAGQQSLENALRQLLPT